MFCESEMNHDSLSSRHAHRNIRADALKFKRRGSLTEFRDSICHGGGEGFVCVYLQKKREVVCFFFFFLNIPLKGVYHSERRKHVVTDNVVTTS